MKNEDYLNWFKSLNEEQGIQILKEYHLVKQKLCAEILLIPTGAKDWTLRAIRKAKYFSIADRELTRLLIETRKSLNKASFYAKDLICQNCMGSGKVENHTCCICKGKRKNGWEDFWKNDNTFDF